jgi:OFA family oxalate/formate antiporter-like MFS transporter
VLVGLGMILASLSQARIGSSGGFAPLMVAGLGLMVGCGAGLTFASAVPPGVQWLVPKRRGLVIGLVVAGMSLGPAWLNGSAVQFVRARGVDSVLFVQGIALLAVIVSLSQFIDGPLPGYVPPGSYSEATGMVPDVLRWSGMSSRQTLGSRAFRVLWTRTALLGAAVAMLLVRALPVMARAFPSQPALWGCVAGVVGGLAAGLLHDRVGEPGSYVVFVVLLIAVSGGGVLLAAGYATAAFVVSAAAWSGGLVSVWISTIDSFGLRRAGANFGLVFTGWCVGVLLGALAIVGFATGMPVHLGFVGPETGMALAFAVVLASAALMGLRVRVPVELPAHEEDRPR